MRRAYLRRAIKLSFLPSLLFSFLPYVVAPFFKNLFLFLYVITTLSHKNTFLL